MRDDKRWEMTNAQWQCALVLRWSVSRSWYLWWTAYM